MECVMRYLPTQRVAVAVAVGVGGRGRLTNDTNTLVLNVEFNKTD